MIDVTLNYDVINLLSEDKLKLFNTWLEEQCYVDTLNGPLSAVTVTDNKTCAMYEVWDAGLSVEHGTLTLHGNTGCSGAGLNIEVSFKSGTELVSVSLDNENKGDEFSIYHEFSIMFEFHDQDKLDELNTLFGGVFAE